MSKININGVEYEQIVREPSNSTPRTGSRTMVTALMAMATMFSGMGGMGGGDSRQRKLPPGINIIDEFILIQDKKSKLSKWERDTVCRIFRNNFRKVTTA